MLYPTLLSSSKAPSRADNKMSRVQVVWPVWQSIQQFEEMSDREGPVFAYPQAEKPFILEMNDSGLAW